MTDLITNILNQLPTDLIINLTYIISALLFIIGLKKLGSAKTARYGNFLSASGMLLAALITLIDKNIVSFEWILLGLGIGTVIGIRLRQPPPAAAAGHRRREPPECDST